MENIIVPLTDNAERVSVVPIIGNLFAVWAFIYGILFFK